MLKVINVTHVKDPDNAIQLTVLKIDNVILVLIRRRFVNVSAKNSVQFVLGKKETVGIIKIYHLNTLLIVIIY